MREFPANRFISGINIAGMALPLLWHMKLVMSQNYFSESFAVNHIIIFICITICKEQVINFCSKTQRMSADPATWLLTPCCFARCCLIISLPDNLTYSFSIAINTSTFFCKLLASLRRVHLGEGIMWAGKLKSCTLSNGTDLYHYRSEMFKSYSAKWKLHTFKPYRLNKAEIKTCKWGKGWWEV